MKLLPLLNQTVSKYLLIIFLILISFTLFFWILGLIKPSKNSQILSLRTYSWWIILLCFIFMTSISKEVFFISFALISFISYRELISKMDIPLNARRTLFWTYLAIPIQYYLAYKSYMLAFLIFIPVGMLFFIPFRSILLGITDNSIRLFSVLHWGMMLTIFGLSHITYIYSLPDIPGHKSSKIGVILFLVFITQINDVFQFITGTLFGKHKISPKISPNKTVEGIIGGIVLTTFMGYCFRELLPLSTFQAIVSAFIIAVSGFFGDLNMSAIKRDLKIKDMGNFIPGHGGILDRLDSLLFSSVIFFYLYFFWIYL